MFDKIWFKKRQRILLWLLNTPLINKWFRWVMCIDCEDKITEIGPNYYSWGGYYTYKKGKWKLNKKYDFRTHNKYSKRLFYAFKPLWYVFHAWDMVVANRLNPSWNLGFDTFYPDAHPESTSVDGHVVRSGVDETWADIVGGAGVDANDSTANAIAVGWTCSATGGQFQSLYRSMYLFDSSALDDDATIDSATLSIYGSGKNDGEGDTPDINIYSADPQAETSLNSADYVDIGTTAYCDTAVTYANWSTSAYNDFAFNATGKAAVSKTSITKTGARNANFDVAEELSAGATDPASTSNNRQQRLNGYYADETGTSKDPKLVVTVTIAVAIPPLELASTMATMAISLAINIGLPVLSITGELMPGTFGESGGWNEVAKNTTSWINLTKNTP